ncbi:LuxR family transcriptional regulator [Rhizobium sp. NZLR3b]|uniref:response regulator transcription factor n=1 Tax=Rhizobium sp. NZLR3b TaxID=2731101 RepID=UPI001C82F183|nr:LuxR C-terminal-related transcriptional regulator [Rhizobium sp. NZLR3b]MBX5193508.1 LuxR family transcriptional regulator [Rhizobium sp. NZLR3b]
MYVTKHLTAPLKSAIIPSSDSVVAILSNDLDIGPSLHEHVARMSWHPELHGSAETLLSGARAGSFGCIIVDSTMSDLTVSDLTHLICLHAAHCPIVVLTAKPRAAMTVTTSKFRVTFMPKTDDPTILEEEVNAAVRAINDAHRLEAYFLSLTPRERQVMTFVAEGLLNKQVAFRLNISEITVKAHRGKVMRKMNAKTLPDLVKMAARLGPVSGSGNFALPL